MALSVVIYNLNFTAVIITIGGSVQNVAVILQLPDIFMIRGDTIDMRERHQPLPGYFNTADFRVQQI